MKRLILALALVTYTLPAQAELFRPLTNYEITLRGTTPTTTPTTGAYTDSAIGINTRIVNVLCGVTCWFAFSNTPIVDAVSVPVTLAPGENHQLKASPNTYPFVGIQLFGGDIYITEGE